MRRREFIAGVVALLPSTVRAQQSEPIRHVAILIAETTDDPYYEGRFTGMKDGLRNLGWIEGQNLRLDVHRALPRATDLRKHADQLLAGRPDVVVTSGGTATGLMLQVTSTVPVVFMAAVDPVGAGFVEVVMPQGSRSSSTA